MATQLVGAESVSNSDLTAQVPAPKPPASLPYESNRSSSFLFSSIPAPAPCVEAKIFVELILFFAINSMCQSEIPLQGDERIIFSGLFNWLFEQIVSAKMIFQGIEVLLATRNYVNLLALLFTARICLMSSS